ncbi:hypothetical protein [Filomicrobium sp.]|uniref:hypothetical protein n=1 Tax=Filomicrobium sp. TaxID=2024831 RepID=UPI00258F650D|nr:hypothetical protein [Filomicrobium sp.]MCV0371068.1 hypothetical protein [Filomicrobium sp.]
MTIIGQNDGQNSGSAMAYRRISGSLTEVDITLNFGASVARSEIHVYTIEGAKNDTPYDAHFPAGGGGGSRSATLDIPAGGGAIAVAYDGGSGSWTNATEDFQLDESSCASHMTDTLLSSYVIGCGSSVRTIGAASWR